MTKSLWSSCLLAGVLAVLVVGAGSPSSAQSDVDVGAIISETQKEATGSKALGLVWWIPEEVWKAILEEDGGLTPEGIEGILGVLRPYLVIAAVDGSFGPMGAPSFRSQEALRGSLTVIDERGNEYRPLKEEEISGDAKNLFASMKPGLAGIAGPIGEHMHFFCFPAKTEEGRLIADPLESGELAVKMGDKTFQWRLPLGSLLPPKVCPVDGEQLNGAWIYCPWHGDKLQALPATPEAPGEGPHPPSPDPEASG